MNTVRAAYSRLEADRLVQTRHGVGTVRVPPLALPAPAPGAGPLGINTVGVIIGGLRPSAPLLQGIEDVAAEHGTLVLIADAHGPIGRDQVEARFSPAVAEATIRRLVARGVAGIVAVSSGDIDDGEGAEAAARPSPPIVYVEPGDQRAMSSSSTADERDTSRRVTSVSMATRGSGS